MPTPPQWLTIPTDKTLQKYGLNREEYLSIAEQQGYKCPICGKDLNKTVNIDHWHVSNFKKYPPELRKMFVRGILDWFCNYYAMYKGVSIDKLKNAAKYLEDFDKRKPK